MVILNMVTAKSVMSCKIITAAPIGSMFNEYEKKISDQVMR